MNLPVMWNLAGGRCSGQAGYPCQAIILWDSIPLKAYVFGLKTYIVCSRHHSGGNVGIAERFPRTGGKGGKPDFGFPGLSSVRHFHGFLVSTASAIRRKPLLPRERVVLVLSDMGF